METGKPYLRVFLKEMQTFKVSQLVLHHFIHYDFNLTLTEQHESI